MCQTLGPLAETILALSLLRWPAARTRGSLSQWLDQVRHRLTPRVKPLAALLPPGKRGVDLLTITGQSPTIEQGIVSLMAVTDDELGAARLLGRTRAMALSSIGDGCSTTELAARIGTSGWAARAGAG